MRRELRNALCSIGVTSGASDAQAPDESTCLKGAIAE